MSLPSDDSSNELIAHSPCQKQSKEDGIMISRSYPQTGEWVMVGDRVMIDEVHPGKVIRVLLPNSADAQHHECAETGGLLIDTEPFGLMLLPFGSNQELKREAD